MANRSRVSHWIFIYASCHVLAFSIGIADESTSDVPSLAISSFLRCALLTSFCLINIADMKMKLWAVNSNFHLSGIFWRPQRFLPMENGESLSRYDFIFIEAYVLVGLICGIKWEEKKGGGGF